MKKVLVILAVLILIVSSVFAEDKQTIRINTSVESKTPTFVLKAGLSPDSFNRESDDDTMNTLGWETIEKSILQENVVVYFQIAQKGFARKVGSKFVLSIEASEMVREQNEDGSALGPDEVRYKTSRGIISNINPINVKTSNVDVTVSGGTGKDSAEIMAEYKGKVDDGTPIATFTVTWAKDVEALDGIYQASVILRVSPQ